MHLARVETRAMLNSLFDRVTDLQLVPDDDTKIVGHAVPLAEDTFR